VNLRRFGKAFNLIKWIGILAVAVLLWFLCFYLYKHEIKKSNSSSITSSATPSSRQSISPAIPAHGAYLGAWINSPKVLNDYSDPNSNDLATHELSELPNFERSVGNHKPTILSVYEIWGSSVPSVSMASIASAGAIPMIDLSCGSDLQVTNGAFDNYINTYAEAMKSYGKPVFLRYAWEMNIKGSRTEVCQDNTKDYAGYISSWQHIYSIFQKDGATNVAFVWCPSHLNDASQYYPGNQYVNWIGVDGYANNTNGAANNQTFSSVFGSFYQQWSGHNKPMIVGETGAQPGNQSKYLSSMASSMENTYTNIKAVVYFDAGSDTGPTTWALQNSPGDAGLTEYGNLLKSNYFDVTN
jgi:beta-mannanase